MVPSAFPFCKTPPFLFPCYGLTEAQFLVCTEVDSQGSSSRHPGRFSSPLSPWFELVVVQEDIPLLPLFRFGLPSKGIFLFLLLCSDLDFFARRKDQVLWHRRDVLSLAVCAAVATHRGFEGILVVVGCSQWGRVAVAGGSSFVLTEFPGKSGLG
ncbi:hypothetical protein V8G54_036342 [Vigna mungo]|uniref:Uncharacterized protein n=1 Tax=Vigna mungo TaxID=3915 RepID=A0AAQ3RCL9_VIGMU